MKIKVSRRPTIYCLAVAALLAGLFAAGSSHSSPPMPAARRGRRLLALRHQGRRNFAADRLPREVPAPGHVRRGHEAGQTGRRDAQRLCAAGGCPGLSSRWQIPRRRRAGEGRHHRRLGEAHHRASSWTTDIKIWFVMIKDSKGRFPGTTCGATAGAGPHGSIPTKSV